MEKVFYSLMAAAILFSCAKIAEEDKTEEPAVTLTATIDNGDETKTLYEEDAINKKAVLNWIEGDQIRLVVYNNTTAAVGYYTLTAKESGPSVPFTFGGDVQTHSRSGYAVYPTPNLGGNNNDGYMVTLPEGYSVSGTDLSRVKVPMIGKVDPLNENSYTFSAAVGVLKVTLTNVPVNARKLVVTAPDSDNLSGTFPLDAENGYTMSAAIGEAGHSITVSFDQQASGATVSVYVPVPVGSLSTGTTFDVQQTDGTSLKKLTTKMAIPIGKGQLIPLAAFPVEDWITLGQGLFMDDDAFYANGYIGRKAEDYISVTIQQHASNPRRYRVVNPYQAYLDRRGTTKMSGAEGPNEYLTFTLEDNFVLNDSYRTGLQYYNYGYEVAYDHPYWSGVANYWNNQVIRRDAQGNPANIQLAPVYFRNDSWQVVNNASQNPKIEIVFPGSTPMLPNNNYPTRAGATYSAGNVDVTINDGTGTISAVKVKVAASLDAGALALLEGDSDLNFTVTGAKALGLADGTYHLVYMVETDGHGYTIKDGGSFSVDEGEPSSSPWLNLFTDLSCSELRPGVTAADIEAMYGDATRLAEDVAMPLKNGTYSAAEQDFRIHSYEPYSDNRACGPVLLTRLYSLMDNPTGIEVSSGSKIVVCVDQIPSGQTVSLAVYGDTASGYEANIGGGHDINEGYAQNAVLQAGVNTIDITADGLAYVLNTITQTVDQVGILDPRTTPVSSFQPVKVHIIPGSGTVQGYYDPSRHSEARGAEILNACTYKYFMVKGQKCLFLFHTDRLQNYSIADIHSGIDAWDDVIGWQQELSGLDQKAWFNNHMMAISSTEPGNYMDAGHRRVRFHADNALPKIISRQALLDNEGGWGPFHEMGHINQPAIMWRSNWESSNNLFSNYCKKRLVGEAYYVSEFSRGDSIENLAQYYREGKTWATMGDEEALYQGEDTEIHTRMQWQLWNYYHNCGYMPDFWPKLFEYLRQTPLHNNFFDYYWNEGDGTYEDSGLAQLEFYEACCHVAKEDLTEFFEVWGFFRPVDVSVTQYGTEQYKVTQSMIDASKARIAAMNYPKAAPFQYLEDRRTVGNTKYSDLGYWELFRDCPEITVTPKVINIWEDWYTFTQGYENAVAVELRSGEMAEGDLLSFSNMRDFKKTADGTFWAVQADGTRVKITVN